MQNRQERTFDLESIFPNGQACQTRLEELQGELGTLDRFRGALTTSGQSLLEGLEQFARFEVRLFQATLYAFLRHDVDVEDDEAKTLRTLGQAVESEYLARAAWKDAELGDLDDEEFDRLEREEPGLQRWRRGHGEARRRNAHRGSADTERAIAEFEGVTAMSAQLRRILYRDHRYPDIIGNDGKLQPLTRDDLYMQLNNGDARIRRASWDAYRGVRWQHRNTLTSMLNVFVKSKAVESKLRGYASSLEAALDAAQLDLAVHDQTVSMCLGRAEVWHRYWEAKRRTLGLDRLTAIDVNYAFEAQSPTIPYEQAVELVTAALEPLGDEYTQTLRRGLTVEGWVDAYPRPSKATKEYSWTTTGCKPFVMLQYRDNLRSLSSLAHESGHAMHSFYTYKTQLHQYATYGQAAAEVAANFHQAMLFSHLLETSPDPKLRLAVLLEELSLSALYLMRMPINAAFERELYEIVEGGGNLEADRISERYAILERQTLGAAALAKADDIVWGDQAVLYNHFYAFQYALGLAGGQAIAERVRVGHQETVEGYFRFISSGVSIPPLESIHLTGIDFRSSEPVKAALDRVSRNTALLEEILQ